MSLEIVKKSLLDQLTRLSQLDNLSQVESEAELRRSQAINSTAGNLIKLGGLAVAAENIKLCYLEKQGGIPEHLQIGLMND